MNRETLLHTNLQDTFDVVVQSYKTIEINAGNALKAQIVIAHLPSGSGYSSQQDLLENHVKNRCFTVVNSDNYCAIRAVIIAKAFIDLNACTTAAEKKISKVYLNKLTREHSSVLENEVMKVVRKCYIHDKPCGIKEFKLMEIYFKKYQIIIINNDGVLDKIPIYIGQPNTFQIYLCYTGSHYNVIKHIKKMLNCIYLCPLCQTKTRNIPDHFCKFNCKICNRPGCVKDKTIK